MLVDIISNPMKVSTFGNVLVVSKRMHTSTHGSKTPSSLLGVTIAMYGAPFLYTCKSQQTCPMGVEPDQWERIVYHIQHNGVSRFQS
jgi:hypothetical protein